MFHFCKDLDNSLLLSCANECLENENPIESLLKKWRDNTLDVNFSECLLGLTHLY